MGRLMDRVIYLRGLADRFHISETTDEGRMLRAIVDTLSEFADAIEQCPGDKTDEAFIVTCPNCDKEIEINQPSSDGVNNMLCPICGEPIVILNTYL